MRGDDGEKRDLSKQRQVGDKRLTKAETSVAVILVVTSSSNSKKWRDSSGSKRRASVSTDVGSG
ncbi:MAG: hypothetical protein LE178_03780 [Endomicrobium sp.]|nr:hypothetical protein [Endomicrobium sp.]